MALGINRVRRIQVILFLKSIVFFIYSSFSFAITCTQLDGAYVLGQDDDQTYLGFFGSNNAQGSIMNPSSPQGGEFSSNSVRNPNGQFGRDYGAISANSDYASSPPIIYKFDSQIGYLTTGYKSPGIDLATIDSNCSNFNSYYDTTSYAPTINASYSGSLSSTVSSTITINFDISDQDGVSDLFNKPTQIRFSIVNSLFDVQTIDTDEYQNGSYLSGDLQLQSSYIGKEIRVNVIFFDDLNNIYTSPNYSIGVYSPASDGDGDGVGDISDNCPDIPNSDQEDLDSNGVGDACATFTPSNRDELKVAIDLCLTEDPSGNCALQNSISPSGGVYGFIGDWDVSSVTNMSGIFYGASSFNQSLNNWDISNVTNMYKAFEGASSFDQPLNSWNTSKVTDMGRMFWGANNFNQALDNWNTSNVVYMDGMFHSAAEFNQDISIWNTPNLVYINAMFQYAITFNQPLSNFDTSSVTDMRAVFFGATSFDQPINSWNVSNVTDMRWMFKDAANFNQALDSWNVSNVTDMSWMFEDASQFNQSFCWDLDESTDTTDMFLNSNAIFCGISLDTDGDGVPDNQDNCPNDYNAGQSDPDQDGLGWPCDDDRDGDGILNGLDNCPDNSNSDQENLDNDTLGNVCDPDIDGDGINNDVDDFPYTAVAENVDTDGDGVPDDQDNCPNDYNAGQSDPDQDGLGWPCDDDRDGDGILNDIESIFGGNPDDPSDYNDVLTDIESMGLSLNIDEVSIPAMGGIGLLALGLSMLGLGAVRLRV